MSSSYCWLQETADGITLQIKVQARASRPGLILSQNELKIKLSAAPSEGKANEELLDFLKQSLQIPRRNLAILKGLHHRQKSIKISNIGREQILTKLLSLATS